MATHKVCSQIYYLWASIWPSLRARKVASVMVLATLAFTTEALAIEAPAATDDANKEVICTMTFNSPDEGNVFQKFFGKRNYTIKHLVSEEDPNPNWLDNAIADQTRCDHLVISGHFGGIFFGEKLMQTLSVLEMEQKSCDPKKAQFFKNIKSVYLFGCNTLASKQKDTRSPLEYREVLMQHGFSRELAEQVVASRYLDFGPTILDKVEGIFSSTKMIVGFYSKSPLGKQAASPLARAIQKSYAKYGTIDSLVDANILQNEFAGHSIKVLKPDQNSLAKHRSRCEPKQTFQTAAELSNVFDLAVDAKPDSKWIQTLKNDMDSLYVISQYTDRVQNQMTNLTDIEVKILKFKMHLGLTTPIEFNTSLQSLIDQLLEHPKSFNYLKADELCSLLKKMPELRLNNDQLAQLAQTRFATVVKYCQDQKSIDQWMQNPKPGHEQCLVNNRFVARGEAENKALLPCHDKKNQEMYESSACRRERGDWDLCLHPNDKELSLNACLSRANVIGDDEQSDDRRWYCWVRLAEKMRHPECLLLTRSMRILGNQIKMHWNCQNMVRP